MKNNKSKLIEEHLGWRDFCNKSYDGKHVWCQGQMYKPFIIFNLIIPFIQIKILDLFICRVCGIVKRKGAVC